MFDDMCSRLDVTDRQTDIHRPTASTALTRIASRDKKNDAFSVCVNKELIESWVIRLNFVLSIFFVLNLVTI